MHAYEESTYMTDWQYEVANGDTRLGLDAWVELNADARREVDPTPWVDDNLGGRWSTEKMEAYKALGTSFNFTYEPRG